MVNVQVLPWDNVHVSWFSIIIRIQGEKILYMLMTTLNRDQRV